MVAPVGETAVETTRAAQKAETRKRLLQAAVEVFGHGSVTATPVDAVAAAAGVSKATLFFHFGSRLDLLEEVAGTVYGRGLAWRPRTPGLEAFLDTYFDSQTVPETRLVWEIGDVLTVEGRATPTAAYRHLTGYLADRLAEDGVAPDAAERLAGVVAPAVLLVARRVAYREAEAGELERFRADLATLIAPYREAA
jgi:AcrR family transcriptional regulator